METPSTNKTTKPVVKSLGMMNDWRGNIPPEWVECQQVKKHLLQKVRDRSHVTLTCPVCNFRVGYDDSD